MHAREGSVKGLVSAGRGCRCVATLAVLLAWLGLGGAARAQDAEVGASSDEPAESEALPDVEPPDDAALADADLEALGGDAEAGDDAAPEAQAAVDAAGVESAVTTGARAEAPSAPDPEQRNGFVKPESESELSWAGGMELDTGYARYTFESAALNDEDVYDFRGRFVFGPTLEHRFWQDWFVAARGEAVLWVREQLGVYQVNVDDVFAQVGKRGVWDFKLGRFRPWRVYHKGLGFDLYTLEDAGACVQNPCSADAGTFGPHTYEVSYLYDRETAGRGAFHVYPSRWSGLELAATYGQGGVSNTWGVRGAGMVHFDFLRVMAAAEYRSARPREEASALDPDGNTVACDKCGVSERVGFGGGVEVTVAPIEVGLNAARGSADLYTVTSGAFDEGGSNTTTSLGGYAELDVGSLAFERRLVVGFGLNRTEALAVNENFRRHVQAAAYVAYPLGFDAAMVKLVLSRSDLTGLTLVDEVNRVFTEAKSAVSAARLRFVYPF
jgi:hypothetical protein